jgi:drug/metabolite transporter (DMT)-like permease
MVRWAVTRVDPFALTGFAFLFGTAAFFPLCFRAPPKLPKSFRGAPPGPRFWLWTGLAAGALISCASLLQSHGMIWTTSGKSAFISSLYVVLVPLMAFATGRRPGPGVWAGLVFGVSGFYFISLAEDGGGGFNRGDALTLAAAACLASHLLLVGRCANRVDPVRFTTTKTAVAAASCLTVASARGALPGWDAFIETLPVTLFGVVSISCSHSVQTFCQRHVRASEAAMILQLKAVFAALFGMAFLNEDMTPSMWAGAALVVFGSIIAQSNAERSALSEADPCAPELLRRAGPTKVQAAAFRSPGP